MTLRPLPAQVAGKTEAEIAVGISAGRRRLVSMTPTAHRCRLVRKEGCGLVRWFSQASFRPFLRTATMPARLCKRAFSARLQITRNDADHNFGPS
jgi:hypothetical protein